jgi:pyrimidine deaminase RibD-like protein
LILGDGYSRQIPGNTHGEANALTNFRTAYAALLAKEHALPPVEDVLSEVECYVTMEPCSIRTSGGPSCALELVKARVKTVYLVSWAVLLINMRVRPALIDQ